MESQKPQQPKSSPQTRYSPETLRKVVELASRIQMETRETLTAEEVEAIGKEVGLDAVFVRQAMSEFVKEQQAIKTREHVTKPTIWRKLLRDWLAASWWAAGWTIPFILATLVQSHLAAPLFFAGWGIYIGGGMLLSAWARTAGAQPDKLQPLPNKLSRADLLEMLFALQRMLEGQKQRRVFLSVDVVGSSEMKRSSSELEVEHSFHQFHCWLSEVIAKHGGQIHSVAGDGAMCMFEDDVEAVKAALELQRSIAQFNASKNLLPIPFQIRCGISAGNVPVEDGAPIGKIHSHVLDRAAHLQKRAKPGGIVVGGEVAGVALMLLGSVSPLPASPNGQTAFEWRPEDKFSLEAM
ncbi:MAG: adenylate/guanylate cyclase domain-containing protein [Armatimonadota bacterium]|nr:adenylate/guanylate cyclase domain-containing protein [Armatimonadota bacterium]MDW8143535.1 adenylate/guanylate cyclase domain-containing protein [Armatimonadota bacterium]